MISRIPVITKLQSANQEMELLHVNVETATLRQTTVTECALVRAFNKLETENVRV